MAWKCLPTKWAETISFFCMPAIVYSEKRYVAIKTRFQADLLVHITIFNSLQQVIVGFLISNLGSGVRRLSHLSIIPLVVFTTGIVPGLVPTLFC